MCRARTWPVSVVVLEVALIIRSKDMRAASMSSLSSASALSAVARRRWPSCAPVHCLVTVLPGRASGIAWVKWGRVFAELHWSRMGAAGTATPVCALVLRHDAIPAMQHGPAWVRAVVCTT